MEIRVGFILVFVPSSTEAGNKHYPTSWPHQHPWCETPRSQAVPSVRRRGVWLVLQAEAGMQLASPSTGQGGEQSPGLVTPGDSSLPFCTEQMVRWHPSPAGRWKDNEIVYNYSRKGRDKALCAIMAASVSVTTLQKLPWGQDLKEGISLTIYQPRFSSEARMDAELLHTYLIYPAAWGTSPTHRSLVLLQHTWNRAQSSTAQT